MRQSDGWYPLELKCDAMAAAFDALRQRGAGDGASAADADAFATARQLAPNGSLAQDALAREVEAWSKAGRPDDAYRAARQYVAR